MKKQMSLFFVFLFAISLVLAAHVVSKAGGGSYSVNEGVSSLYNISIVNEDASASANISRVDILFNSSVFSFVSNSQGSDTGISPTFTSGLGAINWSGDGLVMNSATKYFWFNLITSVPGDYNLTIVTVNQTDSYQANVSVSVSDIAPRVTLDVPVTKGNYSDSISMSATVLDSFTDGVFFNITNISGIQVGNYTATNSSNTWTATLNTNDYSGGFYNITVYANDSTGNLNNTEVAYSVRFDNANPGIDFLDYVDEDALCDDASLTSGDVLHCGCEGTDADSGVYTINDIQTTRYQWNITTSSTGNKYAECTVVDYAQNSITSRFNYTVTSADSDSSSSGSTAASYWTITHNEADKELKDKGMVNKTLKKKERIKLKIGEEIHYVGIVDLDSNSVKINVSSTPQQKEFKVNDTYKFDVTDDIYYDLAITLNAISGSYANISIISINEEIPVELRTQDGDSGSNFISSGGNETGDGLFGGKLEGNYLWITLIIVFILIIGLVIYFLVVKGGKTSRHVSATDWR